MTDDPTKEPSPEAPPPDTPAGEAEEVAADDDELRAKLEEEIKSVRVEDVILQSTVSILNLAARRIAKEDEKDLPQGKAGIDAVRDLLPHLPDDAAERVREALSELQMLYAREAGEGEKPEKAETPPGSSAPGA